MKVVGALTDESSNSERELQVQIPWQCTLALLGRNMLHSTAHLLHRYGLLSFYWMFTPQGIGSILLKFRSLLPLLTCCCSCSSTTSVTFLFHTVHPNHDNISITLQAWSGEWGGWSKSLHFKCLYQLHLCFQALRLCSQQKKSPKSKSYTLFLPFTEWCLHSVSQSYNTITLNPPLYSELQVILMMKQSHLV